MNAIDKLTQELTPLTAREQTDITGGESIYLNLIDHLQPIFGGRPYPLYPLPDGFNPYGG